MQTEVLYGKAMEFAGLTGRETVIDAYCGIGTIGVIAAKTAGQVLGVEVNRDAVRDAIANAKLNNMKTSASSAPTRANLWWIWRRTASTATCS